MSNSSLPDKVRIAAFSSLFALLGDRDNQLDFFLNFSFPEDIDWRLIESFRTYNPPPIGTDKLSVLPSVSEKEKAAFFFFQEGVKALNDGEYLKAVNFFSEVVNCFPNGAGGYLMRGKAYLRSGMIDKAINDFTQTIMINPQSATAFMERSQAYSQKGLIILAKNDYHKAKGINGGETGT